MASEISLKMTFKPVPVAQVPDHVGTGSPKTADDVAESLKKSVGAGAVISLEKAHKGDPFVVVDSKKLLEALRFLRDDERYLCTMLEVIAAVDYLPKTETPPAPVAGAEAAPAKTKPGYIAVVYVLWSFQHRHQITIQVHLDRDHPSVSSVVDLYRAANWYERECYDMLGVTFEGHPDHARILLPPDWVGHPLRRDYVFPEEYNGMKVPL